MKSRQRRLKAIELSLTPLQVVVVWLRNAIQAGTLEDGARTRRTPPPREAVANAVRNAVRNSMKGQPELLVERAILQARREADFVYNLVIGANVAVIENMERREREYILLLGYLGAETRGNPTKDRVQALHSAVLMFLDSVIILDAAITQVTAERLNGQPVLFRDSAVKVGEQLQMAEKLSERFNFLARAVGAAEINLEELRNSLQSESDRQVSIWVNQARLQMLGTFGTEKELQVAMEQSFLLFKSNGGHSSDNVDT
jgi:hypothetical protein